MFLSNLSTLTGLWNEWDLLKVVILKHVESVLLAYDLCLGLCSSKKFLRLVFSFFNVFNSISCVELFKDDVPFIFNLLKQHN